VHRRQFTLQTSAALMLGTLGSAAALSARAADANAVPNMSAQQAYQLATHGNGFFVGPMMASNTVYVFFDTTCPHCAHLWQASQPLLNRVKMVWMPVGFLRPQSTTQGATILSAAEPAKAMTENEQRLMNRQGGIVVADPLNEAAVAKVKTNTAIFAKLEANSVPLILFRNSRTGEYGNQAGASDTAQLEALFGV
jgi:thiol:disulfide interchange protein DsbG